MIWSFLLLSSIWFAYEFINVLAPTLWDKLMVLSCSVPVGFTLTSYFSLFFRLFSPFNVLVGVILSMFFFIFATMIHYTAPRNNRILRPITPQFLLMSMFFFVLFAILINRSFLQNGIGSSGTVYSDLPFHLGLITSFAYGTNSENSSMSTPFYFGEKLSYPIIPDYFSAILIGAGYAPIRISICVPTLFLLMSVIFSLHYLGLLFSSKSYIPEFAVVCFIFASGVGWRYAFLKECRNDINVNYVHNFCTDIYTFWIHPLIHFLLPQRSAAFSMPLAICITSLLILAVDSHLKDKKIVFLAGLLMGMLPLLSAHTYIAVGEYAIFICLLFFPFKQPTQWVPTVLYWSVFGFTALALSIPQVIWLLRVPRHGFMTFQAICLETFPGKFTLMKFFKLWWDSLGSFVFLAFLPSLLLMTRRQQMIYLPSIGVFLVSNFICYQPGAMDNNKVFFAGWYPIACLAVSNFFWCIIRNARKNAIFIYCVLGLVFFSFIYGSLVCIYKAAAYSFPLFERYDMYAGEWIMENSRKDTTFLCSWWHSNTAMSIGGRHVVMGYGGWVWSHGLSLDNRAKLINQLLQNLENNSLFDKYNMQYAISKFDDERRGFRFPEVDSFSHWIRIFDSSVIRVYRMVHD